MIKSGCIHTESLCPVVFSQGKLADSHESKELSSLEQDLVSEQLIQPNSGWNLQTKPFGKKFENL